MKKRTSHPVNKELMQRLNKHGIETKDLAEMFGRTKTNWQNSSMRKRLEEGILNLLNKLEV